ncbi:hypothetical protein F7R14_08240 [Pseudomonas lini]|uniref:Uncharacterized protein n=1 Tax=Pseudomonas lini TaxID=163011 RepID=A0A7V7P5W6_9PSED|nr:hypothetical protein F7R14_08240 [Pseudomonas lini]
MSNTGQSKCRTCGSGLARESGLTFNANVDCQSAFASKPAPTWIVLSRGVTCLFLVHGLIIRRHDRSNSILKGIFPAYRGQIHERYRSSQRHRHPTNRRDARRDGECCHR